MGVNGNCYAKRGSSLHRLFKSLREILRLVVDPLYQFFYKIAFTLNLSEI